MTSHTELKGEREADALNPPKKKNKTDPQMELQVHP